MSRELCAEPIGETEHGDRVFFYRPQTVTAGQRGREGMKDEQIWVTFAAAALGGLATNVNSTFSEDASHAAEAADKLLRELRIRRAVEREVVAAPEQTSTETKEGNGYMKVEKTRPVAAHDAVNHPPHYTSDPSGVECITVVEHRTFNVGNAIKYLWRAGLKGDALEDVKKARWYVDREIERLGKGGAQ